MTIYVVKTNPAVRDTTVSKFTPSNEAAIVGGLQGFVSDRDGSKLIIAQPDGAMTASLFEFDRSNSTMKGVGKLHTIMHDSMQCPTNSRRGSVLERIVSYTVDTGGQNLMVTLTGEDSARVHEEVFEPQDETRTVSDGATGVQYRVCPSLTHVETERKAGNALSFNRLMLSSAE